MRGIEHSRGGEIRKLGTCADSELGEQRGHVKLYGTHADGKQRGDLLIGEIFGDGAQDFAFALAEGNG